MALLTVETASDIAKTLVSMELEPQLLLTSRDYLLDISLPDQGVAIQVGLSYTTRHQSYQMIMMPMLNASRLRGLTVFKKCTLYDNSQQPVIFLVSLSEWQYKNLQTQHQ